MASLNASFGYCRSYTKVKGIRFEAEQKTTVKTLDVTSVKTLDGVVFFPEAQKAILKEWKKLEDLRVWDFASVKPRAQVIAETKTAGKRVHFANIMELCHEKHSEFATEFELQGLYLRLQDLQISSMPLCQAADEVGPCLRRAKRRRRV